MHSPWCICANAFSNSARRAPRASFCRLSSAILCAYPGKPSPLPAMVTAVASHERGAIMPSLGEHTVSALGGLLRAARVLAVTSLGVHRCAGYRAAHDRTFPQEDRPAG